ncbi:MAG: phosphatidylserine decarboxylase family protein [Planctomycetes bacterium]|nr:phosphatidylserine decarboxylase family protein [Planctomycetota bacterium]
MNYRLLISLNLCYSVVMRISITKYGWPQVVIYPAVILVVMAGVALGTGGVLQLWAIITIEGLLGTILIWILSFFRDPERNCPSDRNLLLSPADGQITDIEEVENCDFISGAAMRVGIFLSIFNTHINRAPCNVKVEKITYKKGKYKNALNPESAQVNESNELNLVRTDSPHDRLIVRQISGAIARRIVCKTTEGSELAGGEKFGMLKFGSRTELYVPQSENAKCMVKIGDKVKAGLTTLIKYE